MIKATQSALRFQPALWAAVTNLLLLAGAFALFAGRKPGRFRSEAIVDAFPGFYSHVSNFSISYVLYAGVGFLWVMMGVRPRHVALAGVAVVVANVVYELLLPILNTRDPVDALYGIAGAVLGFVWLAIFRRFGLKPLAQAGRR